MRLKLRQRDGRVVVHGQVGKVDRARIQLQALLDGLLHAVMREDTQEYCRRLRYESEAKRDALYAQLEKEKEEIEKNNSSEGSDPSTWTCLETSPSVGGGVS